MTYLPNRLNPEVVYEQRKALVKDMVAKESAGQDGITARLRALRLAKQKHDNEMPSSD